MANDADIRQLSRAVKSLEDKFADLGRVLVAINTNFTEYLRMLKEAQESKEVTRFKVDEEYLRNQPPEQWVEPEEHNGN